MKVKAIRMGYYGHKRIREGEVFELQPMKFKKNDKIEIVPVEKQFSKAWMEAVDSGEGKKPKGKAEELSA